MPTKLNAHPDFASIRLLTCDVDGVLTDGGLYYGDNGERYKKFHVLDGQGLKMLQKDGVKTCLISQSTNRSIVMRASDLGVDYCFTGVGDKLVVIKDVAKSIGVSLSQIVHIADDINDLSLLENVGIPVTVPNGAPRVKRACRFVTSLPGGQGAVRELCEVILAARGTTG